MSTGCETCHYKRCPDGGHCYMFRTKPEGDCTQHAVEITTVKPNCKHQNAATSRSTTTTQQTNVCPDCGHVWTTWTPWRRTMTTPTTLRAWSPSAIAELRAEVEALRLALTAPEQSPAMSLVPTEILGRFPEINPSNYDHDDACALNAWGVELVLAATPAAPTSGESETLPVAHLCSITHPDWLEVCTADQPGAFPVYATPGATPPSAAQAEGAISDEMALAFHRAISDGSIGQDDLEDIKTGLRAALTAAPEKLEPLNGMTKEAALAWLDGLKQQAPVPEKLAPAPQQAGQDNDEFETRADGKRVRKDRWQWGIRRIVALLWGNRHEFEVDEVVEAVRKLLPTPFADGEDEALVDSVGRGLTTPSPQQAAQGGDLGFYKEFEAWWRKHGQFSRAGGGDYEKTFAFNAWTAARAAQGGREGLTEPDAIGPESITSAALQAALKQNRPLNLDQRSVLWQLVADRDGREGLSAEQIDEIWVEHGCEGEDAYAFARAIERAHGIGITTPAGDSE